MMLGQAEDALAFLKTSEEVLGADPFLIYWRAWLLLEDGRTAKAADQIERNIAPNLPPRLRPIAEVFFVKDERTAMPVHEELKQRGTISDIPSPPQRELVTARPVRACARVCSINTEHNQIWGKSVSDTVRSTEIYIHPS